jgi:hypothetical protein
VPGVKQAIDEFHSLFLAKFGAKPDIVGGRDGKLISDLIKRHSSDQVLLLLKQFFEFPPKWVKETDNFTIPAFHASYTQLIAASRNGKSEMRAFG